MEDMDELMQVSHFITIKVLTWSFYFYIIGQLARYPQKKCIKLFFIT